MQYDVEFLQEAMNDLEELVLYLYGESPSAALSVHDAIIERAEDLKLFPKRGKPVPDKKMSAAGYRMLGVKSHIMFYRVIGQMVYIYRVLHTATNYPMLYEKMIGAIDVDELEQLNAKGE